VFFHFPNLRRKRIYYNRKRPIVKEKPQKNVHNALFALLFYRCHHKTPYYRGFTRIIKQKTARLGGFVFPGND